MEIIEGKDMEMERPAGAKVAPRKDWIEAHLEQVAAAWPELDISVEGLVTRLSKLQRYLDRNLADTLREFDLGQGEFKVLVNLKGGGRSECSPGELCDMMLVSSGSMTNRLDRLEEAGLIRRKPDPEDRRGVLVELTDQGDKLIEAAVYAVGRKEARLFGNLSETERGTLSDILGKLLHELEETYGPPPKKRAVLWTQ